MAGVEDESVDAVFSSHNIEHVFPHEVPLVVREFFRVLKPHGFAVITCPDLQALGEALAAGRLLEPLYQSGMGPIAPIDIIYGHRASIEAGEHYMAHRGGFTRESLSAGLRAGGFAMVGCQRVREGAENLWALATKRPIREAEMLQRCKQFFTRPARSRRPS
jgi:SAM-dependent methyltransferase